MHQALVCVLNSLTAPDGNAVADGILSLVGGDIAASGKAQLKSADLQPFIATAGYTLPGFGEGLSADLSSDFQFAKGLLRFPNFAGKLGGDDISARIEANFSDSGLPQIKGEAKLASIELASLAGIMLGQDAIEPTKARKGSVWPKNTFAVRPSLPLLMDMKLTAARRIWMDLEQSVIFPRGCKSIDGLTLGELTGNWAGGYLVGNVSLRNNDKTALLASDLKWSGAALQDFYHLPDGGVPLAGTVKAALSLNCSGTSVAELVSSLAGTGSADVENFAINGLDAASFPAMLTAADTLADQPTGATQIDAKQFVAIADKAVGQGQFIAGMTRFDFTVAGGIARLSPFSLSAGDAVLSGDLQFDLSTLALGGTGSLSFKNADNAEADGAANLRYSIGGTYDAPSAQFDRQPLVQFLTQRALEREQERVEAMQASIVENSSCVANLICLLPMNRNASV